MIKAVIFDMDGLMFDSERLTYQCNVEILKEKNLTMSEDFYKTLLGKTIIMATQLMHEEYGEDFPVKEHIQKVHQLLHKKMHEDGVPKKEGLVELLKYLKENDYLTIVATSSDRHRVDDILNVADVAQYYHDSICGNEVTKGKPDPEIFLKACQKLGVEPHEALVLEDSEAGIQAAYNASIPVICIPDMKYPEEKIENLTERIFQSLYEVIDYLEEKNND